MTSGPLLALAVHLGLQMVAQAPPSPTPIASPATVRSTVVVVDDRVVKDQAPPAFVARAIDEIGRRKGLVVLRMSEGRKRLDARADQALTACADDAGCLAAAVRDMGGNVIVTLRLTRRESASFLAATRVSALRPQIADDAATLAGNDDDALAFVPEAIAELFADTELRTP